MQKSLLLMALASISLAACNKDDEGTDSPTPTTPQAEFVIDGVRDMRLDSGINSNILPIAISRPANSTTQEVVTLSAPELPAGFSASFSPASGTPSFASTVTFSYDYSGNGGTFPAKIVGTSASGSKTYTLNLTAPSLSNGWVLDGELFTASTVTTTNINGVSYINATQPSPNGRLTIRFPYQQSLPTAASTALSIVENPINTGQVALIVEDRNYIDYYSTGTGSPTGTLTYQNGKYSFRCTNVEVETSSGAVKKRVNIKISQ